MKKKKQKGYWEKRVESFADAGRAKERAAALRTHGEVAHVQVSKDKEGYSVSYAVAKWYLEALAEAGVTL